MILRDYQRQAVAETHRHWDSGTRSVLLHLATGLGKTVIASQILADRKRHGRSLWIAHREELIQQAATSLRRAGLTVEIERAEERALVVSLTPSDVVVATVQTLQKRRLKRWPPDAFATIVADEAHRSVAHTYRRIFDHFAKAKRLGLTATPDRSDEVALAHVYDEVGLTYGIREGIEGGYLTPIHARLVQVGDLDLDAVRTQSGDLAAGELDALFAREKAMHQVADPLAAESGERPTLVFTPGVQTARELARVLAGYVGGDAVASIDGSTPRDQRRAILAAYKRGDLRYLVNCAVLTEGFDAPATSCVAMVRPTKSRALYAQCVGRGTRTLPGVVDGIADASGRRAAILASDKPDMLLLDFTGRRQAVDLVGPEDILGGEDLPQEVKRHARKRLEQGGKAQSLEDLLDEVAQHSAMREARLTEDRLKSRLRAVSKYVTAPLEVLGGGEAYVELAEEACRAARSVNRGGPNATDRQRQYLASRGVALPKSASVAQAKRAIDAMVASGLPSIKQARVLQRAGLPTDVPPKVASTLIDGLKRHNWQTTPAMVRWADERRLRVVTDHAAE